MSEAWTNNATETVAQYLGEELNALASKHPKAKPAKLALLFKEFAENYEDLDGSNLLLERIGSKGIATIDWVELASFEIHF